MIWVVDATVTVEEQARLSKQLVEQGCRYACCAGHECSTWDDFIDFAYMETDEDFDPPNENSVMTTWHEEESIGDVAEFLARNTSFDNFVPKNFLCLFIGTDGELIARADEVLRAALFIE